MEIYASLPAVNKTLTESTFQNIKNSGSRIQVAKLFILTLGDAFIHAFAASAKWVFTAVRLPICLWTKEKALLNVTMNEAAAHTLRAIKLVAAASLVTVPALACPSVALSSYKWLDLRYEAPPSAPLSRMERMRQAFRKALNSRYRNPALILGALSILVIWKLAYGTFRLPHNDGQETSDHSTSNRKAEPGELQIFVDADNVLHVGSKKTTLASLEETIQSEVQLLKNQDPNARPFLRANLDFLKQRDIINKIQGLAMEKNYPFRISQQSTVIKRK